MKKFISDIKNIDISIVKIMKNGFKFSLILCLIATYILYLYTITPISHFVFDIGYALTRCSFMFFTCFFIGAIATDKIKKNIM